MSAHWFYHQGHQQVGPISMQELRQLVRSGGLRPTDLVWREGMAQWETAGEAQGLFPSAEPDAPLAVAVLADDPEQVLTVVHAGDDAAPGSRLAWSVTTALPVVGAVPWALLALRGKGAKHAGTALVYAVWPLVGLLIATVVIALTMTHAVSRELIGGYTLFLWGGMWLASVVAAQRAWPTLGEREPARRDDRSLALGYFLWLTLGWVGAHRFYAGRWGTGLLYAFSFGLLGVGWAADLFLLPGLLAPTDRRPAEPPEEVIEEAIPLAPWARRHSVLGLCGFVSRVGFFLSAPVFFVAFSVMMKRTELILLMVVTAVACGLVGNLSRGLRRFEAARKLPLVGPALDKFQELHAFYFEHRPRSFWFYLFYPVTGPIACLTSASRRTELRLYGRLLAVVLGVIVLDQIHSYFSTYPPHLGLRDAVILVLACSFLAVMIVTVFMVPMITTSFYLNLTGQQTKLKALTIIGLVLALPFGVYLYYDQASHVSFLSSRLLEMRLEKESFRQELQEASSMFLRYHVQRLAGDAPAGLAGHAELTQKYHRHVAGLALHDEVHAFRVFTLRSAGGTWCGVRLWYGLTGDPPALLFLMSPEGRLYTSWKELPRAVQERFRVVPDVQIGEENQLELIGQPALLDDLKGQSPGASRSP